MPGPYNIIVLIYDQIHIARNTVASCSVTKATRLYDHILIYTRIPHHLCIGRGIQSFIETPKMFKDPPVQKMQRLTLNSPPCFPPVPLPPDLATPVSCLLHWAVTPVLLPLLHPLRSFRITDASIHQSLYGVAYDSRVQYVEATVSDHHWRYNRMEQQDAALSSATFASTVVSLYPVLLMSLSLLSFNQRRTTLLRNPFTTKHFFVMRAHMPASIAAC